VEVCRRTGAGGDVFILINHARQPATVTLPRPMRNVLADSPAGAVVTLPRYGVAILRPQ
jgi:beta-galactosidase GanA